MFPWETTRCENSLEFTQASYISTSKIEGIIVDYTDLMTFGQNKPKKQKNKIQFNIDHSLLKSGMICVL